MKEVYFAFKNKQIILKYVYVSVFEICSIEKHIGNLGKKFDKLPAIQVIIEKRQNVSKEKKYRFKFQKTKQTKKQLLSNSFPDKQKR